MPKFTKLQQKVMDTRDESLKEARKRVKEILSKDPKTRNNVAKIEQSLYDTVRNNVTAANRKDIKDYNYKDEDFMFSEYIFGAVKIPFYQSLGDTMGFYNGNWEFNNGKEDVGPEYVNELIYEFISLGGVNDIDLTNWKASDDTIMYLATLRVLLAGFSDINDYGEKLRLAYLDTIPLMDKRYPGSTVLKSLEDQKKIAWNTLPYNDAAIGAGAAMRTGCIGMLYPGSENRDTLIVLAVEACRITHNSAIAILGSVVTALFTAYGLEKIAVELWPLKLTKLLHSNRIDQYMKKSRPHEYSLYARDKVLFVSQWDNYLHKRFIGKKPREERMWKNPVTRFETLSKNFSKKCDQPGACGDDAGIMAYDALLESGNVFEKLIVYSVLHPGDSDTVGSIAFSWYGAYYYPTDGDYRYTSIVNKFEQLEFYNELNLLVDDLVVVMTKVYYYDIYIGMALHHLKQFK